MAWRVRYAPATAASSQAGTPAHRIVAYKQFAARDPVRAQPTGAFPLGGAPLMGSAYDGCITPRLEVPGPPVYRYYAWRPAAALKPGGCSRGTGITRRDRDPGDRRLRARRARAGHAARHASVLGSSEGVRCMPETEPSLFHGSAAETTLYTAGSGALVFATGTLGWLYGLWPVPQASPDVPLAPDPRVVAMTRNLLARVLAGAGGAGGAYLGASP